MGWLN